MLNKINEIFTLTSIKSYVKACIDLSAYLNFFKEEDYNLIIIPSRGAYPFYRWSKYYMQKTMKHTERINYYQNHWLLPFTSDWGTENLNFGSKEMRLYWTKIIADSLKNEKGLYTRFYNHLISDIGSYLTINTMHLKLPENIVINDEKFIFIDTAISGQAICEIIEGFKINNLNNYHIILIVENNGEHLKDKYITIINTEIANQRLTLIKVEKIFSEDASPIFNGGISSIVFPNLISRAYNSINEFSQSNCVGAGIWFIDSMSHLKDKHKELNGVMGSIATYLNGVMIDLIQEKNKKGLINNEFIEYQNSCISKEIQKSEINIFDSLSTKQLVYDRIKLRNNQIINENEVDVSRSHVIRINFKDNYIDNFLKQIK